MPLLQRPDARPEGRWFRPMGGSRELRGAFSARPGRWPRSASPRLVLPMHSAVSAPQYRPRNRRKGGQPEASGCVRARPAASAMQGARRGQPEAGPPLLTRSRSLNWVAGSGASPALIRDEHLGHDADCPSTRGLQDATGRTREWRFHERGAAGSRAPPVGKRNDWRQRAWSGGGWERLALDARRAAPLAPRLNEELAALVVETEILYSDEPWTTRSNGSCSS